MYDRDTSSLALRTLIFLRPCASHSAKRTDDPNIPNLFTSNYFSDKVKQPQVMLLPLD